MSQSYIVKFYFLLPGINLDFDDDELFQSASKRDGKIAEKCRHFGGFTYVFLGATQAYVGKNSDDGSESICRSTFLYYPY